MVGIYKIENLINGELYIGSSNNIKQRKNAHLSALRHKKHYNIILQKMFDIYGEENILIDVVEETSLEILITREQYYIDILKPQYNICKFAGRSVGYKHKEKAKILMSLAHIGRVITQETKDRKNKTLRGLKRSDEIKKKMSERLIGHTLSEETKKKISLAHKGKIILEETKKKISIASSKSVVQKTKDGKIIKVFKSIREASKEMNIPETNISQVCSGYSHRKTAGGFKWQYKT
jgi:group I intron endonuclease